MLDPWHLALLFAWVCGVARVAVLVVDHKPMYLELAFVGLTAITSVVVAAKALQRRHARRRA
jgi:hypothetical protein